MIPEFPNRKNPGVIGNINNHVQDYQTCRSETDGGRGK